VVTAVITAVMGTNTRDVTFREFYFSIGEFLLWELNENWLNSIEGDDASTKAKKVKQMLWAVKVDALSNQSPQQELVAACLRSDTPRCRPVGVNPKGGTALFLSPNSISVN